MKSAEILSVFAVALALGVGIGSIGRSTAGDPAIDAAAPRPAEETASVAETAPPPQTQRSHAPTANAAILTKEGDGHYWADADVDGTHVKFMVDTGASTVALTYRDAQRIGLDPDSLDYAWRVGTAGGDVMGASVLLERIRIGQVEVENVEAMVLREGLRQSLLGMTFLGELDSYEFRRRNLILRR